MNIFKVFFGGRKRTSHDKNRNSESAEKLRPHLDFSHFSDRARHILEEEDFSLISFLEQDERESAAFKGAVRTLLGAKRGEKVRVYTKTYEERRQLDSVTHDYKWTDYDVFLDASDQWTETCKATRYSKNMQSD
ncbi:MAG: hypothetical protein ABW076_18150 [Candidatus Thiodiazotropha sp.]